MKIVRKAESIIVTSMLGLSQTRWISIRLSLVECNTLRCPFKARTLLAYLLHLVL